MARPKKLYFHRNQTRFARAPVISPSQKGRKKLYRTPLSYSGAFGFEPMPATFWAGRLEALAWALGWTMMGLRDFLGLPSTLFSRMNDGTLGEHAFHVHRSTELVLTTLGIECGFLVPSGDPRADDYFYRWVYDPSGVDGFHLLRRDSAKEVELQYLPSEWRVRTGIGAWGRARRSVLGAAEPPPPEASLDWNFDGGSQRELVRDWVRLGTYPQNPEHRGWLESQEKLIQRYRETGLDPWEPVDPAVIGEAWRKARSFKEGRALYVQQIRLREALAKGPVALAKPPFGFRGTTEGRQPRRRTDIDLFNRRRLEMMRRRREAQGLTTREPLPEDEVAHKGTTEPLTTSEETADNASHEEPATD